MPTLATHLGYNNGQLPVAQGCEELPAGFIGIEVELEAGNTDDVWPAAAGWELKPDGSLRDGMEYVFDGPQSGATALASIRSLSSAMEAYEPDPTFRCSTHIHLDVRDLEWFQYQKLVLLYMVYEDVMFDHAQPYRRTSNFCIPFMSNDWLGTRFGRQVIGAESDRHRFSHLSQWPKYSALNLQTTTSFGTVEFRGQHALFHEDDLIALAQRMLHLKRFVLADTSATLEDFLVAAEAGPDAVFLQGLNPGYAMTEGALDMGLSAAWGCITQAVIPEEVPAVPLWMDAPPRDNHHMLREVLQRRVTFNIPALNNLNLEATSDTGNYQRALTILSALNSLQGVRVNLSDITTTRRNAGVLRFLREQEANIRTHFGIRVSSENII